MTKEQEINTLIESCASALREDGYSESNIARHRKFWKRIRKYMEEHSIQMYNADVGNQFLDEMEEYHVSLRKAFRRSVFLLTDYLSCGKIRDRIVQYVTHELPGEIGEVAKGFMTSLAPKRLKLSTLKDYQRTLSYLIIHLSAKSIHRPSEIGQNEILSFIASAKRGRRGIIIVMRSFCRYLYEQKIVGQDIGYVIGKDNYPVREKLPSVYVAEEIKQIENAVNRASAVGKRDYAMLLLTTRLGLRSSDVAGLQFGNIDWENNIIRLTQFKTQRDIELPLLMEVGEAIIDYLRYGRPSFQSQQIFLSACAPYRPVNRMMINSAIGRVITASNVCIQNRKFGPHAMRHSLASRLLHNGTPIHVISETLGHSGTQTTMEYLRIDFKSLMGCTLDVPVVPDGFYQQKGGVFYE